MGFLLAGEKSMIQVKALAKGRAEILIYDPIGQNWYGEGFTAKKFVDDLERLGDVTDITVRINSPGGEVFDGFAIYNALKNHKAQIHVQIDG
ncbi:MAG: ATP-dependent Clp protease proteolytic subunit, partial [Burkholderiales bacterium]